MNRLTFALLGTVLTGCEPGASVPSIAEAPASVHTSATATDPTIAPPLAPSAASVAAVPAPAASNEPDAPAAKRRYSVAAIGDSLSDPKAHGGGYLTHLAKRCKESRFDTYGKGGNMVSQMRQRFARDVLGKGDGAEPRPRYTHMIVLGGIADIGSRETAGRTLEKIQGDLLAMYAMAKEAGMTVIAVTIPPWGAWHTYDDEMHRMMLAMNAWLRAKPEHVSHVVDVFPKLVCDEKVLCTQFASDKIHWNKAAHELFGEMLFEQVFSDCE